METPQVSVIIPTLNAGTTLQNCLESLLAQRVSIEVLLCDGGSIDNTLTIAKQFKELIICSSSADTGIYDAMNRGIDHARGEWLMFMGADDELASASALANMLAECPYNCDLMIGKVRNLPPRHRLVKEWYVAQWNSAIYTRNIVHHQGVLYRKSIFENYRYPTDLNVFGDYHLNLHLFLNSKKACLTQVHLSNCASDGRSKRFQGALYLEEWRMKRSVLPFSRRWYQPMVIFMKFLRKRFR